MKTVLFAPGNNQNKNTHDYEALFSAISSKGYNVIFVQITWDNTSFDDWLLQYEKEYQKLVPKDTVLAGFSYGAMIAFAAAAKRPPFELWLMSLAPFFAEDLNLPRLAWLFIKGRQRIRPFQKLYFNKLAPQITCKTTLYVGEIESKKYRSLEKRAIDAKRQIKYSKLIRIPNTVHDVTSQRYMKSIEENI